MPWGFSQMHNWDIVTSWYSGNRWSWGPLSYPRPPMSDTNSAGLAEHRAANSDKERYPKYKYNRACLLRWLDNLLRLQLWQTCIFWSKKSRVACICLQSWAMGWAQQLEEGFNKSFQHRTLASCKQYVKSGVGLRSLQFVRQRSLGLQWTQIIIFYKSKFTQQHTCMWQLRSFGARVGTERTAFSLTWKRRTPIRASAWSKWGEHRGEAHPFVQWWRKCACLGDVKQIQNCKFKLAFCFSSIQNTICYSPSMRCFFPRINPDRCRWDTHPRLHALALPRWFVVLKRFLCSPKCGHSSSIPTGTTLTRLAQPQSPQSFPLKRFRPSAGQLQAHCLATCPTPDGQFVRRTQVST